MGVAHAFEQSTLKHASFDIPMNLESNKINLLDLSNKNGHCVEICHLSMTWQKLGGNGK